MSHEVLIESGSPIPAQRAARLPYQTPTMEILLDTSVPFPRDPNFGVSSNIGRFEPAPSVVDTYVEQPKGLFDRATERLGEIASRFAKPALVVETAVGGAAGAVVITIVQPDVPSAEASGNQMLVTGGSVGVECLDDGDPLLNGNELMVEDPNYAQKIVTGEVLIALGGAPVAAVGGEGDKTAIVEPISPDEAYSNLLLPAPACPVTEPTPTPEITPRPSPPPICGPDGQPIPAVDEPAGEPVAAVDGGIPVDNTDPNQEEPSQPPTDTTTAAADTDGDGDIDEDDLTDVDGDGDIDEDDKTAAADPADKKILSEKDCELIKLSGNEYIDMLVNQGLGKKGSIEKTPYRRLESAILSIWNDYKAILSETEIPDYDGEKFSKTYIKWHLGVIHRGNPNVPVSKYNLKAQMASYAASLAVVLVTVADKTEDPYLKRDLFMASDTAYDHAVSLNPTENLERSKKFVDGEILAFADFYLNS